MPSPFADDQSPVTPSSFEDAARLAASPEPQSRTGKFLQGIFKRTEDQMAEMVELPINLATEQPEQPDLIQVVPEASNWDDGEDSNWDDGEDSNWDDDFMDEPLAKVPRSAAAIPVEPVGLTSEIIETPPPPVATPRSIVPELAEVIEPPDNQTIRVNIPRPKNIKYKNKDQSHTTATKSSSVGQKLEKTEQIEFNVKRPATIKYKTKPVEQPSWLEKILAPGRKLWRKMLAWGDVIPTQLTENPKKVLGILAAVGLSIVTSWAVVNFWPSSSSSSPVAIKPPAIINAGTSAISPEETLITAVRSQLSTLASQYPAGLISNLELDNQRQLAIVTLGNLWASLTGDQRQQVAQSLWQQARTYQMAKVEIRSGTGNLLARSPVVGSEMVVVSNW